MTRASSPSGRWVSATGLNPSWSGIATATRAMTRRGSGRSWATTSARGGMKNATARVKPGSSVAAAMRTTTVVASHTSGSQRGFSCRDGAGCSLRVSVVTTAAATASRSAPSYRTRLRATWAMRSTAPPVAGTLTWNTTYWSHTRSNPHEADAARTTTAPVAAAATAAIHRRCESRTAATTMTQGIKWRLLTATPAPSNAPASQGAQAAGARNAARIPSTPKASAMPSDCIGAAA